MKDLVFETAGLALELCPERAAFVPERKELLVADVHLGKAAAFRRAGKPLPRGTTRAELERIDALVARKGAARLTFLGDLFHAEVEVDSPTAHLFREWLKARGQALEITLVRGNHDRHAHALIAELPFVSLPEPFAPPGSPVDYRHHPGGERPWVAGHVHPGVRLGDGTDAMRLPVFWEQAGAGLVLPAFGRFTGLQIVAGGPGDRFAAATPTAVVQLPASAEVPIRKPDERESVTDNVAMARPTPELISALRSTAARLREGSPFAWGHMGACICGHLAQTITCLSPAEIHARAMERHGDWSEQSVEHCPASGLAIDHVIDEMLALGMVHSDIRHLERLSDPRVLARVPARYLRRQEQANAVQYMEAWAELLEHELALEDRSRSGEPAAPSETAGAEREALETTEAAR